VKAVITSEVTKHEVSREDSEDKHEVAKYIEIVSEKGGKANYLTYFVVKNYLRDLKRDSARGLSFQQPPTNLFSKLLADILSQTIFSLSATATLPPLLTSLTLLPDSWSVIYRYLNYLADT
jgi:hypothetical protein